MFNAANPASLLVPMLVVVALTFIAFFRMAQMRGAAVKGGHDPAYYKAHLGTPEPEATVVAVRHYGNLLELPTLFYAACLAAFALGMTSTAALGLAWAFAVLRVLQSAVHITSNNTLVRGAFFSLGALALLALWVVIGLEVFARL